MQAIKHSLELILDAVTKPDLSHESFLDVEEHSREEGHENNDINNGYDDGYNGLPIDSTMIIIDQDNGSELKGEYDST